MCLANCCVDKLVDYHMVTSMYYRNHHCFLNDDNGDVMMISHGFLKPHS